MSTHSGLPDSHYVMGRTSGEYERLRQQAEVLEPATRAVLERAGLSQGMTCLDVGCGPGEVMRFMAERVGPGGKVVGLDVDGTLGRESLSILHTRGFRQCRFVEGDVHNFDPRDHGPFDLVFTRLVLMHLDNPVGALQKMWDCLKPGGVLVVQDFYFEALDSHPDFAPVQEFKQVFFGDLEKAGRETRMGVKLPHHFMQAGIGIPDGTDVAGNLLPVGEAAKMMRAVYCSILPAALKLGITTETRSASLLRQFDEAQSDGSYLLWPLLISAWKRKVG